MSVPVHVICGPTMRTTASSGVASASGGGNELRGPRALLDAGRTTGPRARTAAHPETIARAHARTNSEAKGLIIIALSRKSADGEARFTRRVVVRDRGRLGVRLRVLDAEL